MTKMLLVEDHEELWDFLSRRLRRRGFEVVLAHDGQQALDQVAAETPDIVLLDMNLPVDGRLDRGAHLARAVEPRRRIIALTAHAMAGDRAKALEAGCDEYHAKPVDFDVLLQQIDEMLLRRGGARGLTATSAPARQVGSPIRCSVMRSATIPRALTSCPSGTFREPVSCGPAPATMICSAWRRRVPGKETAWPVFCSSRITKRSGTS